jgi:hypothetical protein
MEFRVGDDDKDMIVGVLLGVGCFVALHLEKKNALEIPRIERR